MIIGIWIMNDDVTGMADGNLSSLGHLEWRVLVEPLVIYRLNTKQPSF